MSLALQGHRRNLLELAFRILYIAELSLAYVFVLFLKLHYHFAYTLCLCYKT